MAVTFKEEFDRIFITMFHETTDNEMGGFDYGDFIDIHIPEKSADILR